jgi:hypothetical protein
MRQGSLPPITPHSAAASWPPTYACRQHKSLYHTLRISIRCFVAFTRNSLELKFQLKLLLLLLLVVPRLQDLQGMHRAMLGPTLRGPSSHALGSS